MKRKLDLIIHPSGALQIDAIGFCGPDCEKATAFLEQALGEVSSKQRKPEFRHRVLRKTTQRVGL